MKTSTKTFLIFRFLNRSHPNFLNVRKMTFLFGVNKYFIICCFMRTKLYMVAGYEWGGQNVKCFTSFLCNGSKYSLLTWY
jgi:hypothetical protein